LISFQIDLVLPQYHTGKAPNNQDIIDVVSTRRNIVIVGIFFILGTLVQVGAHPKEMVNLPRKPLDVLILGHLLRMPARASKPSRRPSPTQVRVYLGLQD